MPNYQVICCDTDIPCYQSLRVLDQPQVVQIPVPIPTPVPVPGITGPAGQNGITPLFQYANLYNTSVLTIPAGAAIQFVNSGLISAGISYSPATSNGLMTINVPGIYSVSFTVVPSAPSAFGLFLNGSLVPGSAFGTLAANQEISGSVLIQVASVPSTLSVVNITNPGVVVTLAATSIGLQLANNASITVVQVSVGISSAVSLPPGADLL